MISKATSKRRKAALTWTVYVMESVRKAKKTKNTTYIDVANEDSAMLIENALAALEISGVVEARFVVVKLHERTH